MSDSQWRIDLARQISTVYPADAIVLVGSPAFGLADAYSDVDVVMFWEEVPSDDERIKIGQSYGHVHVVDSFNHQAEFSLQNAAEVIHLGESKLKLDITHKSITAQNQMVEEVLIGLDTNLKKLSQIRNISKGIVFKGQAIFDTWHNRYHPMPATLADKLIAQYLHFWAYQPLHKLVIERNDSLFARQLMTGNCEKIVQAICVMNGEYPPDKSKHLQYLLEGLEQAPTTYERIQQVCNHPIEEAYPILKSLIEDTFDYADHFGYDTRKARQHYGTLRQANSEIITLEKVK